MEKSSAPLGKMTVRYDISAEDLALHVDLTGLVYPQTEGCPVPVVLVGLPAPRVPEFYQKFFKPEVKRKTIVKENGKKHYVRFGRMLDLYRIMLALDGRTKVHQVAVRAIRNKLEKKYGKERLMAALQKAAAQEAMERTANE